MDMIGAMYEVECKKHSEKTYIGETEGDEVQGIYGHSVIGHKLKIGPRQEREELEITNIPRRRSIRLQNKEEIDYKKMDEGEKVVNLDRETSEVKEHLHETPHNKGDVEITILNYEQYW